MDPIAHTLTGGALAAAGLRRATPLATAALLIGANVPDVDVVMHFAGDYASLAHRRGWTHGVLALLLWPFVVTGLLLGFDRWRRRPATQRARAAPLLGISALAVMTHPTLDWLNNYGLRWLMPLDGRWFYGDALFIIDPWVWLTLGGVLCLACSERAIWVAVWCSLALFASVLVLLTEVPAAARILWLAGLAAFAAARLAGITARAHPAAIERASAIALVVVGVYMGASLLANLPARAQIREALSQAGVEHIGDVMLGPVPANPLAGQVVAETPDAYYTGRWHWLETPRFQPSSAPIPKRDDGPIVEAARATRDAQHYLAWARFPYYEIEAHDEGYVVHIDDARYPDGRLAGVAVRLDRNLEPAGKAASATTR